MSEAREKSGAEKPAPDPSDIVLALERLAAPSAKEEAEGRRSWTGRLFALLAALAGFAVLSWVLTRNQRELARLRHEENKREILLEEARVERRAALIGEGVADARKKIDAAEERLRQLRSEREHIEAKHEANRDALSRITSFDQFRFRR